MSLGRERCRHVHVSVCLLVEICLFVCVSLFVLLCRVFARSLPPQGPKVLADPGPALRIRASPTSRSIQSQWQASPSTPSTRSCPRRPSPTSAPAASP
eukprot:11255767-Heterocapsa_arctica.AAC.1